MLMKEVKEVVDTVSVALANGQPEEAGNVVMQEVNHALLSMGVDEAMADKIDNFIILLFIIGIALLANLICRKIILRTVAKLVRQTKATWDDIVFNDKVMVNISRMVAPILIYISIPIAFPEHADSALLDFLRRLCMIYILAARGCWDKWLSSRTAQSLQSFFASSVLCSRLCIWYIARVNNIKTNL